MVPPDVIAVEVVFAHSDRQLLLKLTVKPATTVAQAIAQSALAGEFPGVDFAACTVGIWGKIVSLEQPVREGDRIEVYRPLLIDPREARRQLAEHGQFMGNLG